LFCSWHGCGPDAGAAHIIVVMTLLFVQSPRYTFLVLDLSSLAPTIKYDMSKYSIAIYINMDKDEVELPYAE
jgi:hypothetical protein